MKFIDVSMHNGDINWNSVKESGIEAVIIKATEGTTYKDPFRNIHYEGAKNSRLHIGFYHYLKFTSVPETQAENFWNEIKYKQFDIKPQLDVEDEDNRAEDYSKRFMKRFKELSGLDMGIYSGRYYTQAYFSDFFCSKNYWWMAEYGSKCKTPAKCGTLTAWQYTENGHVNGVTGNCDVNILYEPENFFINGYIVNNITPESNMNEFKGIIKVRDLQVICNNINAAGLVEDGLYGPATDAAIKKLPICKNGEPNIPELVVWIQLRVGTSPDGIFGQETEKAVKGWQSKTGLIVDGISGYNTYKSLCLA